MLKPDISRKDIELDQICRQNNMVPLQHSKDEIVDDFHRIFKLFEKLNKKLTEENLKDCFSGQEMIFLQILYQMEINAIAIDRNLLENILQECKLRSDAIKNQIFEEAGTSFNIQSPLQVRKILFEVMKIPYPTSTSIMEDKSKQQSTSVKN